MMVLLYGEGRQELGGHMQMVSVLGLDLILSRLSGKWTDSNSEQLLFSVPSLGGPMAIKLNQYSIFHVLAVLVLWK